MCTAISFNSDKHFFGRNLDYEHSFGEQVVITPRKFPLYFRHTCAINEHFALIGMAVIANGVPLYFDATNEKGLSIAGLLFSGYAHYHEVKTNKTNLAPFEVIPWILSQCQSTDEAKKLLANVNLADTHFSDKYPNTPLHWIVSDKKNSIVIESVADGMKVYDNPVGVLTNSPDFPIHLFNLNNYMHLSPTSPQNNAFSDLNLEVYSRGMGALGLPGDFSSVSRFVRTAFLKACTPKDEKNGIKTFFDILKNTSPPSGTIITDEGKNEVTQYSSCVDTASGIYHYTTYDGSNFCAVSLHAQNLDTDNLYSFALDKSFSTIDQNTPTATFSYNLFH